MKLLDYAHCDDPTLRLSTISADTVKVPAIQRDESLSLIDQFSTVIGLLEYKWERPQSEMGAAILQMLVNMRETMRKQYEARQLESESGR